jgi:hypothetical protein
VLAGLLGLQRLQAALYTQDMANVLGFAGELVVELPCMQLHAAVAAAEQWHRSSSS